VGSIFAAISSSALQRQGEHHQKPNDQQPVHKAPRLYHCESNTHARGRVPRTPLSRILVQPLSERQHNVWMAAAIFSFSLHPLAKKISAKKLSHSA
jgi:hypothetical protein